MSGEEEDTQVRLQVAALNSHWHISVYIRMI